MGLAQRMQEMDTRAVESRVPLTAGKTAGRFAVVLARPERYEDVATIAGRFDEEHAVLLNLEAATGAASRRLLDFLDGVAYALDGRLIRVSRDAYLLVPSSAELLDEAEAEEWEPVF